MKSRNGNKNQKDSLGIVPQPLEICRNEGAEFVVTGSTVIVCADSASRPIAEYLQERMERAAGMKLAVADSGEENAIILKVAPDRVPYDEGEAYRFESAETAIVIMGKQPRGLFYGVQTLLQLLPPGIYSSPPLQGLRLAVPAVTIADRPTAAGIRGLHVDIARHFRTKDELTTIIDCMAMHKLNTLHLHLSDDEGWRIEIKAYPKLTSIGAIGCRSDPTAPAAFLSQDQMRELCAYAEKQYISIIPEIDMPGHMGAAIRAYPGLKNERDTREPARVIQGGPRAIAFAKTVLTEIRELFEPDHVHVGFDEVNYGANAELFSDEELVRFAETICTFIKSDLNATPIVWDDVFVKGWRDKDTLVQWWRYGLVHWWKDMEMPVDALLNLEKQPSILSPACWTYFDMANEGGGGWAGSISVAEMYNWDPLEDMIGVSDDTRHLMRGSIACTWSEGMPTMDRFCEQTFPRLAAYSERVWCGGRSEMQASLDWSDWRDQVLIPFQLERYRALGINYWGKDQRDLLANLKDSRKRLERESLQGIAGDP